MTIGELITELSTLDPHKELRIVECYDEPDSYVVTGVYKDGTLEIGLSDSDPNSDLTPYVRGEKS
jgi:hypothetical protein